jgi:hypothetical protein
MWHPFLRNKSEEMEDIYFKQHYLLLHAHYWIDAHLEQMQICYFKANPTAKSQIIFIVIVK